MRMNHCAHRTTHGTTHSTTHSTTHRTTNRTPARLWWLPALLLAACAAPAPEAPKPPPPAPVAAPEPPARPGPPAAAVRPVTETFFGRSVTDPYRYLEDTRQPEVAAFMRGQADFTRQTLDAIPGRRAMAARIDQLAAAGNEVSGVQLTGAGAEPTLFYFKQAAGDSTRKVYTRTGYTGAERLVFDPAAISAPGKRYTVNRFLASPSGHNVAIAVAAGGSETTSLYVVNAVNPGEAALIIDRIGFAEATHWSPDGRAFFYNRLPEEKAEGGKNRYLGSRVLRHVMGRPTEQDEVLFGPGSRDISFLDIDIPEVQLAGNGKFWLGSIRHGDLNEISLYSAPVAANLPPAWTKVADTGDDVTAFVADEKNLYLLSHHQAPRFQVLRTPLDKPNLAKATVAIPQGDTVLRELSIAKDAIYVRELFGGVDRLQRLLFGGLLARDRMEFVRLPFDLAIGEMITSPLRDGALLRLQGWTESPRYTSVEARSGNLKDTGLQEKSAADFSAIDEVYLTVTARDGAKVPLSLYYKKSTVLNADNPTLLRAYGAYGISQAAVFNPAALAWLERGGILGVCHVRGGGEFGEDWHKAGQKLQKPNTWRDLIDCGEYLLQRKFTRKEKLAIQGGSAGGITVGRAMTERPDLFAAVIAQVGLLDPLRMEGTPNGPPNVPEFGSARTEDGFKGLYEMSALHHVRDGENYPAVLLMHGVNDPRVEVWNSLKMAARLQAAVAKAPFANPVLLRLDYDAGHGIGSSRTQRNAELADIYSFLLWQFGDPAFQPK